MLLSSHSFLRTQRKNVKTIGKIWAGTHVLNVFFSRYGGDHIGTYKDHPVVTVVPHAAHAIIFDQSHDNESLLEQRSVYDVLSTSAILAMSCAATGSTRGYDELVPHHIHVVSEEREYMPWNVSAST